MTRTKKREGSTSNLKNYWSKRKRKGKIFRVSARNPFTEFVQVNANIYDSSPPPPQMERITNINRNENLFYLSGRRIVLHFKNDICIIYGMIFTISKQLQLEEICIIINMVCLTNNTDNSSSNNNGSNNTTNNSNNNLTVENT
ncbi:uncharacterized protein V1477_011500 [Vespula maculifrons]|uniref:Uncharacterized protein n=1 Tax=Vespula maculifrons TaxID=7453 RepID=A0ABD2BZE4_VESMC